MNRQEILTKLDESVYNVIGTHVAPDAALSDSGLDSMTKVDLALAVGKAFGCKIPATEIDEYLESIDTLAAFVEEHQTASAKA